MSAADVTLTSESSETPNTTTEPVSEETPAVDLSGAEAPAEKTPAVEGQPEAVEEVQPDASKDTGEAPVYEPFIIPDGMAAAEEDLKVFTDLAAEMGADQVHAQKLIDLGVQVAESTVAQMEQLRAQETAAEIQEAKDALRNDPVLGGKNLKTTQLNMNAFHRTGLIPDSLIERWTKSGEIFKPEVAGMLNELGKLVQEDPITFGDAGGGGGNPDRAQRMFAKSGHN